MSTSAIPQVVLNSGHKMPMLAMGTGASPLPPPDELTSILIDAIATGYRHFDTAELYGSEESLGRAVAAALDRGLIKGRDEVFITSKLWCSHAHPDLVLPALKESLRKLGLEYLDLYLIHWPLTLKPGSKMQNLTKEDVVPFDMRGTWEAMEECCRLGLTKSIGVSNFTCAKLSTLLEHAKIPPAVNQVELSVAWQQQKLIKFCKEKGIAVSAWSPLGANGAFWGTLAIKESSVLKDIAAAKQKSFAQIALRWVYEQGVTPIVKSFNKERMKQNLDIFHWQLSDEELHQIQQIPQKRGYTAENIILLAHYKSVEEFWDGEI